MPARKKVLQAQTRKEIIATLASLKDKTRSLIYDLADSRKIFDNGRVRSPEEIKKKEEEAVFQLLTFGRAAGQKIDRIILDLKKEWGIP